MQVPTFAAVFNEEERPSNEQTTALSTGRGQTSQSVRALQEQGISSTGRRLDGSTGEGTEVRILTSPA